MTLNQLKSKLVAYFESHRQVNTVHFEDDFEFNAERDLVYPVVNIEYLDSDINNKNITHNFKVVIGDVVSADRPELQDEVISDSLQIAEDFFSYLQDTEGFIFNRTTNIQKFLDDTHDRVSGVVFRVALSQIRLQNNCAAPTIQP